MRQRIARVAAKGITPTVECPTWATAGQVAAFAGVVRGECATVGTPSVCKALHCADGTWVVGLNMLDVEAADVARLMCRLEVVANRFWEDRRPRPALTCPRALRVLVALTARAAQAGEDFAVAASLMDLSRDTGLSVESVKTQVRRLVRGGEVGLTPRSGKATVYVLHRPIPSPMTA